MDKGCQSSAASSRDSSVTTAIGSSSNANFTGNNGRDQYIRQLNKFSHKISKPVVAKKPTFDSPQNQQQNHSLSHNPPQPPPPPPPQQQQSLQHQPPVYNINKNDFRDVVQKLTGSPAHERMSTPPPIQQPKPPSSRLQRIRPPPLVQISNRPPPLLNGAAPHPQPPIMNPPSAIPNNPVNSFPVNNFSGFGRPVAPLSPLPPFPAVHAAAESPISAYMRYLQNSVSNIDSNSKQFSGFSPLAPLVSPRWNNFTPQQPQPEPRSQAQEITSSQTTATAQSQSQFQMPASPVPFGCLNSPRSPYPLLSPGLLFSPSSGQLGFPQFPLSPTVPLPSPKYRGL
ncbi:VQ motif-containing protein 9-like [Prosopis cineraria]|uniref:VQ motif-containing protein 9-like n=1 Tax=Prosopis cineraria TaxID=364024 RepID=UPI00240FA2EE|nr:VQ motif-containing protein 9-like [Prosopis cineraria]